MSTQPLPPSPPSPVPLPLDELVAIALARESLAPFDLYVSLRGRVPRRVFWLHGVLALLLVAMLSNALMDIAGVAAEISGKLVNVLLAWPFIAVSVKRLHDYDFRGWWLLVNLVPAIGSLATLLANGFIRGTPGPNRFGPDPLASQHAHPAARSAHAPRAQRSPFESRRGTPRTEKVSTAH
jgi:uncharacterized membrane protein YhaH (DUF805 family)